MPEVSRFVGIIIAMYYDDHSPPHFHAKYGGDQASVRIDNGEVLEGRLELALCAWSRSGALSTKRNCLKTGNALRPGNL